jgi:hypothetical protein
VISIIDDIETTLLILENNLESTNNVTESFQRDILHKVITIKNIDRYIKRQRRINSLKSPFIKARGVLQGILGENIEEIQDEELIDLTSLNEEHDLARNILDNLTYPECIEYFKTVLKNSLSKANKKWSKPH